MAAGTGPLYTDTASARPRFLRRTFFQIPIPVAQPALKLEPKIPGAVFRHLCALAPFLDEMSSV